MLERKFNLALGNRLILGFRYFILGISNMKSCFKNVNKNMQDSEINSKIAIPRFANTEMRI